MSQAVTPGGEPVTLSEVTLSTRDYSKACAHCKKEAAQVAAEAAAAAGGGQQGAEAAGQAKLRACSGCHRAQYCSKTWWVGLPVLRGPAQLAARHQR